MSGSYARSNGSYLGNGSGSFSRSGRFTPASGSYTQGSGSYTPGSGSYTLPAAISSSSGVGGAPLSSTEMGYDVCPSSDFPDFTGFITESQMVTPITQSSDTLSDGISNRCHSVIPSVDHYIQ